MTRRTTSEPTTVVAECRDCGDQHPVGDRTDARTTTQCPSCGAFPYRTTVSNAETPKPDADRIRDSVSDISGVGETAQSALIATFDTFYDFEAAGPDELAAVDGIGSTLADRITNS